MTLNGCASAFVARIASGTRIRASIASHGNAGTLLAPTVGMDVPLAQRLFGIRELHPTNTVRDLLEKVRGLPPEGGPRVIVAQRNDTVTDAHALFSRFDLHHLPVVDGAKVVGIVSTTDLLRFFVANEAAAAAGALLQEVMTPEPEVISVEASIRKAVGILAHASFRCLPVVNPANEIYDILTTRDLVRFLDVSIGH